MQLEIHNLKTFSCLELKGEDAGTFLHNQGTQRVETAPCAHYSLFLDHQGKFRGEGHVLGLEEERYLLLSAWSAAADLHAKLDRHIVADDVELRPLASPLSWFVIQHADAWRLGPGELLEKSGFYFWRGGHLGDSILNGLYFGVPEWEELAGILGVGAESLNHLSEKQLDEGRIRAGVPNPHVDLPEGTVPLASRILTHALNFEKGCYLGQEVINRMHRLERLPLISIAIEVPLGGNPEEFSDSDLATFQTEKGEAIGECTSGFWDGGTFRGVGWIKSKFWGSEIFLGGTVVKIRRI